MVNLEDLEIEYRFSPRRKSIGLTVTAEGKLVVAAPRGAPAAEISRALARHRGWIEHSGPIHIAGAGSSFLPDQRAEYRHQQDGGLG